MFTIPTFWQLSDVTEDPIDLLGSITRERAFVDQTEEATFNHDRLVTVLHDPVRLDDFLQTFDSDPTVTSVRR
ncbi:hypothetical protein D3C87_1853060 [compost metagenome]